MWNHRDHDTADVLSPATGTAEAGGTLYELDTNGPFREIRRMSRGEGDQQVAVEFTPPIPHLLALRDGTTVDGSFAISTQPPAGVITGGWLAERRGRHLEVEVVPSGGWTPGDAQPVARLLFRVIAMFRSWPTTYHWRGVIEVPAPGEDSGGSLPLTSRWERIG